jgi:BCD family chlorophyll transporter-like MFS transporter
LALGAWGAAEASAAGLAIACGGIMRDVVSYYAEQGFMGEALANPATGYSVVYHVEIALLFITLVAIGPLVRGGSKRRARLSGLSAPTVSTLSTAR